MGTGSVDCVELSAVQRNLFIYLATLHFYAKLFVLKLCMSFYVSVIIDEKGHWSKPGNNVSKPMVLNTQFI
jgi:hypothetical protein